MFFKALTFFLFPASVDFSDLPNLLPAAQLKPVGPLELNSVGFTSPLGRNVSNPLYLVQGPAIWLSLGMQSKILPGSVIADKLEDRMKEIEEREGRRPGGRERKRMKDDLIHELLPNAMVAHSRLDALIFPALGLMAVNTGSRKQAEGFASSVRGLLGSFPAMPLNAELAPRSVLTGWIAGESPADGLWLGEECEMKDPVEGGALVKLQHQELRSDEIDQHLDAGKQVTKLALVLQDNLSFVLGDDLVVRKLKFLDGALDKMEEVGEDGLRAELDTRLALMSGEIRELFGVLRTAFKISAVE